jgi:hypothetical protein
MCYDLFAYFSQSVVFCLGSESCCVSEVHILLDMCPAQPAHMQTPTPAKLSLPVKYQTEAVYVIPTLWLYNRTPSDALSKALLC